MWVKTLPETDYGKMIDDLRNFEITVFDYSASSDQITKELKRPERQGLFGVLSVGFMASALLTVLGFLLYALFSFRRRFIELGTLRAIGLSTTQLTIFLICELAFLILLGSQVQTGHRRLYQPGLYTLPPDRRTAQRPTSTLPGREICLVRPSTASTCCFGLLFLVAFSVLIVLLMRMKVFQAIKLGETV